MLLLNDSRNHAIGLMFSRFNAPMSVCYGTITKKHAAPEAAKLDESIGSLKKELDARLSNFIAFKNGFKNGTKESNKCYRL